MATMEQETLRKAWEQQSHVPFPRREGGPLPDLAELDGKIAGQLHTLLFDDSNSARHGQLRADINTSRLMAQQILPSLNSSEQSYLENWLALVANALQEHGVAITSVIALESLGGVTLGESFKDVLERERDLELDDPIGPPDEGDTSQRWSNGRIIVGEDEGIVFSVSLFDEFYVDGINLNGATVNDVLRVLGEPTFRDSDPESIGFFDYDQTNKEFSVYFFDGIVKSVTLADYSLVPD